LAARSSHAASILIYRELRVRLHREFHAEPDPETTALFQQIRAEARVKATPDARRLTPDKLPAVPSVTPAPPLPSLEAFPNNLPLQLTRFIGRERQIEEVKRLLAAHRLLTLTGVGGCGKTRLAQQVAADRLEEFAHGVWFVDLAPLADPALVPQTVAMALAVIEAPGHSLIETLSGILKTRQLLLVLDNCEHLLGACAALATALLQTCPHLRILATSREPLRIAGETPCRVPPLSLPDIGRPLTLETVTQYEAVQLFIDRAVTALPTFTVTNERVPAMTQVCRRLDGIPLAIELAAAQVRVLPVEQIATRLEDRFRLLTGGSRTALPRHQTLRALVDWSHDLLTEPQRLLLQRLSVFSGGWTLAAAEAVCGEGEVLPFDVLELLTGLVDKSLVVYEERGSDARYRYPETIRQYSWDRLFESGEAARVRERHRDFFLRLAEEAEPELRGPEQGEWLDRLEVEHDNLRAALEGCQAEEAGSASPRTRDTSPGAAAPRRPSRGTGGTELRLAGALGWFWVKRGYYSEGRQRLEEALSRGSEAPARVKALHAAGVLAQHQGSYVEASDTFFAEALALARATGDKGGAAFSLFGLGMSVTLGMFATASRQDGERAMALAEQSVALARETADRWLIAPPLMSLGFLAEFRGDIARATALFDEMVVLCRDVGDVWLLATALAHLARMSDYQGDYERATALYKEGLALNPRLEIKRGILWCLTGLAEVEASQQQGERAARLWGAAEALREATHDPIEAFWHASHDGNAAAARAALGDEAFAAAWAEGRAMPLKQAITFALEETT
jgi:predicted ATPase